SAPAHPSGHAFVHEEAGTKYLYFAHPLPLTRVRATLEDFRRPASYEAFTCLEEGSRLDKPRVARDGEGKLLWRWRKNTPPVGPGEQGKLIAKELIRRQDALVQLR